MSEAREGGARLPLPTSGDHAVVCPWCELEHGDCWEWVTDRPTETTCDGCGGTFKCWAEYDVTYNADPRTPPSRQEPQRAEGEP